MSRPDNMPTGRPVNPARLSPYAIQHDRWDKKTFDNLLREMRDFKVEQSILCDSAPTGDCLWGDLLWDLLKVEPHVNPADQIRPKYMVNQKVISEFAELTQVEEIRAMGTVGDDVAAAMGVMALRKDVEGLLDKLKKEQELADQLDDQMAELYEYGQSEDFDPDKAAQMQQDLNEALKQLADQLDGKGDSIRASLKRGADKAAKETEEGNQAAQTYGFDRGAIQRMDAESRIALAKRLNSQKLKDVAALFGRMRRLQLSEQKRRVDYARDEVVSLTVGDDLARMLPTELTKMEDEDLQWLFYLDLIERRVPSYKLEGTDKVGRGGIVYLPDESGSMSGLRDVFSKSLGLCLLSQCRDEGRSFSAYPFSSAYDMREQHFEKPSDFSPEAIIDFVELYFGGGTDPRPALRKAMDYLLEEASSNKLERSDIVIATDGDFGMDDEFLMRLKKDQASIKARIYGLSILNASTHNLEAVCDGRVYHVSDLTTGDQLRGLFGGM